MSPHGNSWNEENLSENPAIEQLEALGYTLVSAEDLETERESLKEVVLTRRLGKALKRLNPWLSENNVQKAVRAVTHVPATSLIEASEKLYTILTYGISLEQDRGEGKKGQMVRFIDFDRPERNEFLVTRQYQVKGAKKHIRPDVVLFVNGIPMAIIECKSPTLGEAWKAEATDQFSRYQEIDARYRDLGHPKLFEPAQILIATCGQAACYGTVTTPHRFYAEWKTMWPGSEGDFAKSHGRAPSAQEILFEGMLAPKNLLDIIQNFVVFERDAATGRTIRKVCRYQQFAAVNKAISRARKVQRPDQRGGVVWHTQGSGKSLTMLWLALKLRRDVTHENPTIVLVTDRKDLDGQITKTFRACGFPNPDQAASVRHLRELLSNSTGKTILTTVQKFQELQEVGNGTKRRTREEYPLLSDATNIFVLADEAHRTQYGGLAAQFAQSLAQRVLLRLHGNAHRQKGSKHASNVRQLHRYLHHRAGREGRSHGSHLLRRASP